MNQTIERKRVELENWAIEIEAQKKEAKTQAEKKAVAAEAQHWLDAYNDWNREMERKKALSQDKYQKIAGTSGSSRGSGSHDDFFGKSIANTLDDVTGLSYEELARVQPDLDGTVIQTRGWQVDPIDKNDRDSIKGVADAIVKNAAVGGHMSHKAFTGAQTKAFTTASSLVPPDLSLPIQERIYDVDIMAMLPVITGSGSTFRFVKDPSTTGTTATVVAEGAAKPQNVVTYTSTDTAYTKLAEFIKLSHETLSDYAQSLPVTIQRAVNDLVSVRNTQLLNGSGTGGNLLGLNTAAGNTIAVPETLPANTTQIDYFTQAVDTLRTAAGVFAVADLAILHPSTWHALCLLKDSLGRYLLNPAPGVAASYQIAGVPVKLSTDQTPGTATLLDTSRYGYAVVRESTLILDGYDASDFIENLRSWVVETRLTQVITRPGALLTITGLPTSVTP